MEQKIAYELLPMDTNSPFVIAYSGSLDGFQQAASGSGFSRIKSYFWTFRNASVDASTRSGFYFIQAVAILKKKFGITPNQLQVKWWGLIDKVNQQQIKQYDVTEYFEIGGYMNKEASIKKLAAADMLFLPLEKTASKNHRTLFIPGKLFEYLKTGKPILALCEDSDCKQILQESGLGIFAKPDNPEEIADCLYHCLTHKEEIMALKPNAEYIQQHSFVQKTRQLAEFIHELSRK